MSFSSYLANLREQPDHVKRRHTFWYSFGITAIIALFWLSSFGGLNSGVSTQVATAVDKVNTPAQSLVAGVGDFASDIWSMITGPKKVTFSEVQVLPGKR